VVVVDGLVFFGILFDHRIVFIQPDRMLEVVVGDGWLWRRSDGGCDFFLLLASVTEVYGRKL
jgi:hypothetical protein